MSLLPLLGPWAYPLLGLSVILVADVLRAAWAILGGADDAPERAPHHTVPAWGVLAGAVGLIGSASGLGRGATGARAAAGGERAEVEAVLDVLGEGALLALSPAGAGLALFGLSVVAWLALHYAWARRRD